MKHYDIDFLDIVLNTLKWLCFIFFKLALFGLFITCVVLENVTKQVNAFIYPILFNKPIPK